MEPGSWRLEDGLVGARNLGFVTVRVTKHIDTPSALLAHTANRPCLDDTLFYAADSKYPFSGTQSSLDSIFVKRRLRL